MAAQPPKSTPGLETSMDARMIGVGAGDIQQAVAAEVERIVKKTRGGVRAQHKLLTEMPRAWCDYRQGGRGHHQIG